MNLKKFEEKDFQGVASLLASFRAELAGFKGIHKEPNLERGISELREYLEECNKEKFFIYVAEHRKNIVGFLLCKVEEGVVWTEALYVSPEYRRNGVASLLFDKAESLAEEFHLETLYNWVHPNNDKIIKFLEKKGYDVLNLIEVRKSRNGEINRNKINVNNHTFNY